MKVKITRTYDLDANVRAAIAHHYGMDTPATHEDCRKWIMENGHDWTLILKRFFEDKAEEFADKAEKL
jgi:hypothetical protein